MSLFHSSPPLAGHPELSTAAAAAGEPVGVKLPPIALLNLSNLLVEDVLGSQLAPISSSLNPSTAAAGKPVGLQLPPSTIDEQVPDPNLHGKGWSLEDDSRLTSLGDGNISGEDGWLAISQELSNSQQVQLPIALLSAP
jgi:hypothetical protein